MRLYVKTTMLCLLITLILSNIGAYIPAYGWGDSFRVDLKVELQKLKNISELPNTTDNELIIQNKNISKIVSEHCSNSEVKELDKLFNDFLNNKNKQTFKIYSEKTTELVAGKPNFILFFAILITILAGLFIIPMKKKIKVKNET